MSLSGRVAGSARRCGPFEAPLMMGASSFASSCTIFSPESRVLLLVPLLGILSGGSSFDASTLAFRLVDFLDVVFGVLAFVVFTSSVTLALGAESLTRSFAARRVDFFATSGSSVFTLLDFRTN